MKAIIPIALMIILVAAISFAAVKMNDKEQITAPELKKFSLKTYTAAVCEDRENHIFCKDEFFVNCNGNVSIASEIAECEGVKIPVPNAMGAAVFDPEWKDPRNPEQI